MPSIRAPAAKKATTLTVSIFPFISIRNLYIWLIVSANCLPQVAVKCRRFTGREQSRDIVRVIDNKVLYFVVD